MAIIETILMNVCKYSFKTVGHVLIYVELQQLINYLLTIRLIDN